MTDVLSSPPLPPPLPGLQDTRLTVTQAGGPSSGGQAVFHFHYQLSEQHSACWDALLRGERLFIQIPPGQLAEGSKEG